MNDEAFAVDFAHARTLNRKAPNWTAHLDLFEHLLLEHVALAHKGKRHAT